MLQLQRVSARSTDVALRARLVNWRTTMIEEDIQLVQLQQAEERHRADLEARLRLDTSMEAGLRQLRQVMVRLAKGDAAMRLEVWRMGMRMEAFVKQQQIQAALETQLKAQGQGAG